MCGRYAAFRSIEEIRRLFGTTNPPPTFAPTWNMAPTRAAPVVRRHPHTGARHLDLLRWGLIPHWITDLKSARSPINARSETAASTPMFRDPLAHRRCLVPVDGFYEWRHEGKQRLPTHITVASHRPFSLAGLWDTWRTPEGLEVVTFTIVTTDANEAIRGLHDRMPVFIAREDRHRWLTDDAHATELLKPWAGEPLQLVAVNPLVNKSTVDDPRCLEPAKTVQLSLL